MQAELHRTDNGIVGILHSGTENAENLGSILDIAEIPYRISVIGAEGDVIVLEKAESEIPP